MLKTKICQLNESRNKHRLAERTEAKGGKALVNVKPVSYGALNDTSSAAQTLSHKVWKQCISNRVIILTLEEK